MPVYEYSCPKCKKEITLQRPMADVDLLPICCDEGCDSIQMNLVLSKGSFQLQGGCWSSDGYSKGRS